jgi:hypothetical protein
VILFLEKTWPFWWAVGSFLIVRWFHVLASDPRIVAIDSSFQPKGEQEDLATPKNLTPSRGFGL